MNWVQCGDCGHVFTDGYFDAETAEKLFSKESFFHEFGWNHHALRNLSADIVKNVRQFASGRRWLDVGIGAGSLLMVADEFGFDAKGIDVRSAPVEKAKSYALNAECVSFQDCSGEYDVISMCDVLEHIPFPKKALKKAHELLAVEGVLMVSCPNAGCSSWSLYNGEGNSYWAEIEHYHNFSRDVLYGLLRESGFEPVFYDVSRRYKVGMEVIAIRTE